MRVVLDPNVLISSLLSRGTTAAVLDPWVERQVYTPVVCPHLLAELTGVLDRKKFVTINDKAKRGLLERLATEGECVDDPLIEDGVTDDAILPSPLASWAVMPSHRSVRNSLERPLNVPKVIPGKAHRRSDHEQVSFCCDLSIDHVSLLALIANVSLQVAEVFEFSDSSRGPRGMQDVDLRGTTNKRRSLS